MGSLAGRDQPRVVISILGGFASGCLLAQREQPIVDIRLDIFACRCLREASAIK
jgi:hypothetical protein